MYHTFQLTMIPTLIIASLMPLMASVVSSFQVNNMMYNNKMNIMISTNYLCLQRTKTYPLIPSYNMRRRLTSIHSSCVICHNSRRGRIKDIGGLVSSPSSSPYAMKLYMCKDIDDFNHIELLDDDDDDDGDQDTHNKSDTNSRKSSSSSTTTSSGKSNRNLHQDIALKRRQRRKRLEKQKETSTFHGTSSGIIDQYDDYCIEDNDIDDDNDDENIDGGSSGPSNRKRTSQQQRIIMNKRKQRRIRNNSNSPDLFSLFEHDSHKNTSSSSNNNGNGRRKRQKRRLLQQQKQQLQDFINEERLINGMQNVAKKTIRKSKVVMDDIGNGLNTIITELYNIDNDDDEDDDGIKEVDWYYDVSTNNNEDDYDRSRRRKKRRKEKNINEREFVYRGEEKKRRRNKVPFESNKQYYDPLSEPNEEHFGNRERPTAVKDVIQIPQNTSTLSRNIEPQVKPVLMLPPTDNIYFPNLDDEKNQNTYSSNEASTQSSNQNINRQNKKYDEDERKAKLEDANERKRSATSSKTRRRRRNPNDKDKKVYSVYPVGVEENVDTELQEMQEIYGKAAADAIDSVGNLMADVVEGKYWNATSSMKEGIRNKMKQQDASTTGARQRSRRKHWRDRLEEKVDYALGVHEDGNYYKKWEEKLERDGMLETGNDAVSIFYGRQRKDHRPKKKVNFFEEDGSLMSLFFGRTPNGKKLSMSRASSTNICTTLFRISIQYSIAALSQVCRWASCRGSLPQPIVVFLLSASALSAPRRRKIVTVGFTLIILRTVAEALHGYTHDDWDGYDNYYDERLDTNTTKV